MKATIEETDEGYKISFLESQVEEDEGYTGYIINVEELEIPVKLLEYLLSAKEE